MEFRLDPTVLDMARNHVGARSDEALGQQFLSKTGVTVRNWRSGRTVPDIRSLMVLRDLTGRPLDTMIIHASAAAA